MPKTSIDNLLTDICQFAVHLFASRSYSIVYSFRREGTLFVFLLEQRGCAADNHAQHRLITCTDDRGESNCPEKRDIYFRPISICATNWRGHLSKSADLPDFSHTNCNYLSPLPFTFEFLNKLFTTTIAIVFLLKVSNNFCNNRP